VAKERHEERLHVLGRDVGTSVEEGPGARGPIEREGAPDRRADRHRLEGPRGPDEADDPVPDQVVQIYAADGVLEFSHLRDRDHGAEPAEGMVAVLLVDDDLPLVGGARIAERGPQEKAVELGLGEGKRPLVLDRVLRGEQEEGLRQPPRDAVHRDLPLGHRLEQRGLGLGHGPVDLVHEHHVGEDRSGPKLEVARLLVVDREPGDVVRLEVGRALDACRLGALDALCDGPG
jgi:hypothetical protein